MSRLPARLQPLWPAVKVAHRKGARIVGGIGRHTGGAARGLPVAAASAAEIARLEGVEYHLMRPARTDRREAPVGTPAGHWLFEQHLDTHVPDQAVVEHRDGRVLGRHAAVVSGAGRLDLDASHYFGLADWREHPVHLSPYPPAPEQVDGAVAVLAARATGHNYFHFLVDALPRLGLLREALPDLEPDAWLVDRAAAYQRTFWSMLGLDTEAVRTIEPQPGLSLRARRLVVPTMPSAEHTIVPRETSDWLRASLPPSAEAAGLPERIYVSRGRTPGTRRLVEEPATLAMLAAHGFTCIEPGSLSVQQQIDHFSAARVIVAPHGAALANLAFARPGVRVLELFAPTYLNPAYWSMVTNIDGHVYRYLVGEGPVPRPGAPLRGLMHDISLPVSAVEKALEDLLAAP